MTLPQTSLFILPKYHSVPNLQAEAGEQERSPSDSVQGAGHLPAGAGPVQADGEPAARAAPRTQEEVQRAHCKTSLCTEVVQS